MFLFSILHGKSFGLESVKTWNSPGFNKYSDWCFNTVWNSSDSLKVCVLFVSQWCSCDADASHDTRSFLSHKMILAQQLEVHLVLKVEPHKKKSFWLVMAAFRRGHLCMEEKERCFSWVYREKELFLRWEPGRVKGEICFPLQIHICKICYWRV